MSRSLSAAALFVVCTFAVACGAGTSTPLAPSSDPQPVTAGGGSGAGQTAKDDQPAATEIKFKGRIASADAETRAIVVDGRTVTVPESATIRSGSAPASFTVLVAGTLVEIIGTEVGGGVTARLVDILTDAQVQLQGAISDLTGTAAAFEFTLEGRRVTGSAATEFKGGSAPSFAGLVTGGKVHVKGLDKGTYVAAERIVLQDLDDEDTPDAPEVEVTGVVTALTGDAPALTLSIGDATVLTTSATTVRIRNQTLSVSDLRVGQTLEVAGTADTTGAIVAKRIQIEEVEPAPAPPAVVTGTVSGIAGTSPDLTLSIGPATVLTTTETVVTRGTETLTLADLAVDQAVVATGTTNADGALVASTIEIDGVAPEPAPAAQPFDATGLVTNATGACPSVSFTMSGKTVVTNISTKYVQLTCGGLTAGTKVRVKGTVAGDGPVTAQWIKKER